MAYRGQNAAEKRETYEYIQPEKPEITALPERGGKPSAKKTPYVKYAMMAAVVFAMLLCMLASYSRLAEVTLDVDKKRAELAELKSDGNALNAKKEQKYNLEYVEEVAISLGMVKMDKNQITYVSIANPEKITTAAAQENEGAAGLVAGIVKSFNAVVEYLN